MGSVLWPYREAAHYPPGEAGGADLALDGWVGVTWAAGRRR